MIRVQLKFGDGDNMPPQKKIKITVGQRETSVSSTVNDAEKDQSTTTAFDADWRVGHWRHRLDYARTNGLLCDVTFEVEGREFGAHKLILAMASPAFEAMFYGGMAEKGDRVVITDLTAEGFKALLGYIYTNATSLSTMEEGFQLWVAADKYCIPHVKTECMAHFGQCPLTPENVWTTLQTALFLDIDTVAKRCFGYLEANAEEVMLMEDFEKISVGAMTSFLDLELNTSELMLMRGLVKWGRARINAQPEMTLKQAVEPCLKLIRFGAMSIEDFCKVLDESHKAFDDGDALTILKHLAKPHYPLPAWCCQITWDRCKTNNYKDPEPHRPISYHVVAGPSRPPKASPSPVLRRKISRRTATSSSSSSSESDSSSSSTSFLEESESSMSSLEERTRPAPGPRRRRRDVEVFHRVLG